MFWSRSTRVFDLDGTLVDTLDDLTLALNEGLSDLGLSPVDESLVRRSLHEGLEGSVAAALAVQHAPALLGDMLLRRYRLHYDAMLIRHARVYPGVHELLEQVCRRGQPPAVCTNKPQAQAQRLLRALGLAPYFAVVVGADTCGQRKPHPAPLLNAIAALGGACPQALMIGDSAVDLACAAAAEVDCLLHGGGYGADLAATASGFDRYESLLHGDQEPAAQSAAGPARVGAHQAVIGRAR